MEEILQRFSHLGETIFDLLDEKYLNFCKKVSRSWKNFIDDPNKKFHWIQIIKEHERNIYIKRFLRTEQINLKWSRLTLRDLKNFVENLRCDHKKRSILFLQMYIRLKASINEKREARR